MKLFKLRPHPRMTLAVGGTLNTTHTSRQVAYCSAHIGKWLLFSTHRQVAYCSAHIGKWLLFSTHRQVATVHHLSSCDSTHKYLSPTWRTFETVAIDPDACFFDLSPDCAC